MMAVAIGIDLRDYLNPIEDMKFVPSWLQYIKFWGNPLEEEILKSYKNIKRGEYIFGDVGGIHPSLANEGIMF